jgi:glutathione S-transferase
MELVAIVMGLALAEYFYFLMRCGAARGRLGVPAPATTGNPEFERYFRVQYNAIEQLVIFLPTMLLFAHYVHAPTAAGIGLVFIVGRFLYGRGYVVDPARRGPGFLITVVSNAVLLAGAIVGAFLAWLR